MATSPRSVVSLAVAFALAVPALAAAQRTASGSSSSTSSGEQATPRSTGSSSSGGSSGGGSGSERTVGSSSSGSSQVTMPEIPTIRSSYESSSSGQRTAPPGSSSGSTATPRSSSGSSSSSGGSSSSSGSSGSSSSASSPRGNNGSSVGRSRDGRPSAGVATPRETIDINGLSFPVYGPSFARWYPFGSTGFGYNFGYVNYDPWFYSRTPWIWGWNGLWYDPYDPFGYNSWYGYNPYGYGYGYPGYGNSYGGGGGSYKTSDENDHVGSIRLRANPSQAQVYVDGALMGVVDDFDGFSSHLKLAGGTHTIELKADGYEPYSGNITVSVGKTVTERISLKKKK